VGVWPTGSGTVGGPPLRWMGSSNLSTTHQTKPSRQDRWIFCPLWWKNHHHRTLCPYRSHLRSFRCWDWKHELQKVL
jgi:hypothetical protein